MRSNTTPMIYILDILYFDFYMSGLFTMEGR